MRETRDIIKSPAEQVTDIERPIDPQLVPGSGRYPAYREMYAADGFSLMDYWQAIRKRLWLVIGIAVLVTTLTAIYMARKPNILSGLGYDPGRSGANKPGPDHQRPPAAKH